MARIVHARLAPYDKRKGALCQRLAAGGQLFEAGKWYKLPEPMADLLEGMAQDSGAPFFEVVRDAAEWERIVRRELAQAIGGPGAAMMADLMAAQPEVAAPPKEEGTILSSKFDGLKAAEVSSKEAATVAAGVAHPPRQPVPGVLTAAAVAHTVEVTEVEEAPADEPEELETPPPPARAPRKRNGGTKKAGPTKRTPRKKA